MVAKNNKGRIMDFIKHDIIELVKIYSIQSEISEKECLKMILDALDVKYIDLEIHHEPDISR